MICLICLSIYSLRQGTLGRLLLRHYDPTMGAILFDGIDYRQLNLSSWDRQIFDMRVLVPHHVGTPIVGWFISWKIHENTIYKLMVTGCTPMTQETSTCFSVWKHLWIMLGNGGASCESVFLKPSYLSPMTVYR